MADTYQWVDAACRLQENEHVITARSVREYASAHHYTDKFAPEIMKVQQQERLMVNLSSSIDRLAIAVSEMKGEGAR